MHGLATSARETSARMRARCRTAPFPVTKPPEMLPMKPSRLLPALAAGLLIAATAHADFVAPRVSPNAKVSQTIGITDLSLTYSRPGVKNRVIWGQLVPYDKPWRTGANDATTFTATTDITVAGQKLAAGTYSFFTIPTQKDWTVIFSKQQNAVVNPTDYDSKQD